MSCGGDVTRAEAYGYALAIIRGKLDGMTPDEIRLSVCGASWLPVCPQGYMIQSGKITVPMFGEHKFDVRKLIGEVRRPAPAIQQGDMFA